MHLPSRASRRRAKRQVETHTLPSTACARHGVAVAVAALSACLLAAPAAEAQPVDAGTLLRDIERRPQPTLPSTTPPVVPAAPATPASTAPQVRIRVTAFVLSGVSLLSEAELQTRLEPFKGRELAFADLQRAADAVAEAYRAKGFLARALLPAQDLQNGVVRINVVEGRVGALRIDDGGSPLRLRESTVRRFMLARSGIGSAVNTDDSQRAINLLNDLPGVSANAVLEPGAGEGESTLVVNARDGALLGGLVQLDNSGVSSTGRARATALGTIDDPLGIGDQVSAGVSFSSHSQYGRAAYALPIGGDGLRASAAFSDLHYDYTDGSRFSGYARTWQAALTYPVHRANDWNLNVGGAYDFKSFRNDNETADVENNLNKKKTRAFGLTASGNAFDSFGGSGYTQYVATVTSGKLDLGGNPADLEADQLSNSARRNGSYSKLALFASRLQRLDAEDTLYVSLTGQLASKNLDSSEKIGAGGPGAVRAYPAGEGNGDQGAVLTLEVRRRLFESLQLAVFYDGARIRRDHSVNEASAARNDVTLQGAGIGLTWGEPKTLLVTLAVAARIGNSQLTTTTTDTTTGATVVHDPGGTANRARAWLTAVRTF